MEITKPSPKPVRRTQEVGDLRKRMMQLFEDPFSFSIFRETVGWIPDVDVSETNGSIVVRAELPGIRQEDLEIQVKDNVLTIAGEKKEEQLQDEKEHYLYECSYGSFRRSLGLPAPVLEDEAKAEFKNGVLTVTLTKSATGGGKRIEING